jgi:hypothetical protein
VFYAGSRDSTVSVWRYDGTTSHDLLAPALMRLWAAEDVLLGIDAVSVGLWLYSGPGDWRKLEGSAGIHFYDAAGVDGSDVFAIGSNTALRHYDGSALRPVWVRGPPVAEAFQEHVVGVDGPYVYVMAGRSLLRGTRRQ